GAAVVGVAREIDAGLAHARAPRPAPARPVDARLEVVAGATPTVAGIAEARLAAGGARGADAAPVHAPLAPPAEVAAAAAVRAVRARVDANIPARDPAGRARGTVRATAVRPARAGLEARRIRRGAGTAPSERGRSREGHQASDPLHGPEDTKRARNIRPGSGVHPTCVP